MFKTGYPLACLVLALLVLSGCTSSPIKAELPVLERYQATDGYQTLVIDSADTFAVPNELGNFIDLVRDYAKHRHLPLVDHNPESPPDRMLLIAQHGIDYSATLYHGQQLLDELEFNELTSERAEMLIDEMLLLWHPPLDKQLSRSPVPAMMLMPVSQSIEKDNFFELAARNMEQMNMGHQSWYELESHTPTFRWEAFPRAWDIADGLNAKDFKHVRYQFRLAPAHSVGIGYATNESAEVITAEVTEPSYTVAQKLELCALYMWTVRALFELNGVPRQTEWSAAISIYPSMMTRPWIKRRNIPSGLALHTTSDLYFFSVKTPKSPFAEACTYQ